MNRSSAEEEEDYEVFDFNGQKWAVVDNSGRYDTLSPLDKQGNGILHWIGQELTFEEQGPRAPYDLYYVYDHCCDTVKEILNTKDVPFQNILVVSDEY